MPSVRVHSTAANVRWNSPVLPTALPALVSGLRDRMPEVGSSFRPTGRSTHILHSRRERIDAEMEFQGDMSVRHSRVRAKSSRLHRVVIVHEQDHGYSGRVRPCLPPHHSPQRVPRFVKDVPNQRVSITDDARSPSHPWPINTLGIVKPQFSHIDVLVVT